MGTPASAGFSLADLSKDCIDGLRRNNVDVPDDLVEERRRTQWLRTGQHRAPRGVCPPVVRYAGVETRCVCVWCGRSKDLALIQKVPFIAARYIAVCTECAAVAHPGESD